MCGKAVELCFADPHLVLGERTCFVSADDGGCSHRFASVHFAHKVVALEHTAHRIGQTQGNCHGKTFGNCYYNYGDGHHKGAEEASGEIKPIDSPRVLGEIEDGAPHKNQESNGITDFADEFAQSV